jgi:hypothetical protein
MNANIRTQLKGTHHTTQVDVQGDFSLDNIVESQTVRNHYQGIHEGQVQDFHQLLWFALALSIAATVTVRFSDANSTQ